MAKPLSILIALALPVALVACSGADERGKSLDTLDGELVEGNGADPALAAALQDQIMVDPNLGQQANGDAVRPPNQPYGAPIPNPMVAANTDPLPGGGELMRAPDPLPNEKCTQCEARSQSLTLGALAARQSGAGAGCAADLDYSARWAARLPADIPLYPQARVTEAAGTDSGRCALRVVSFSSPAPLQSMLDWYYTVVTRAGFSSEHRSDGTEHVLGGTRDRDDSAYVLFMTARSDGGTDVDLVANRGS